MRCLTLANALAEADWRVLFACVEGTTRVVSALARSGFDVIELADPLNSSELAGKLDGHFDAMVFDQYDIDASYERALRPFADILVVIDDLADRQHDCDLLIDQTFGRSAADYIELVPAGSTILAGAQYALLRPEFAAAREASLVRRANAKGVKRILISMGLTDIGGITQKVLQAALKADTGASIDVVLGSDAQSLSAVRELASRRGDIAVYIDTPDICSLMVEADLAIGAAGTTTWERCCLGLPTITLVLAENQGGVSRFLGEVGALSIVEQSSDIPTALERLCGSRDSRHAISVAACAVTDGRGVRRLSDVVRKVVYRRDAGVEKPILRPATIDDAESLWKWRNDPMARFEFVNTEKVSWKDHLAWVQNKLECRNTLLLVAELGGAPIGVLRFELFPQGRAEVSINIDRAFQSRGLGSEILSLGCQQVQCQRRSSVLVANIRNSNMASQRIFEKNGFVFLSQDKHLTKLGKKLQL